MEHHHGSYDHHHPAQIIQQHHHLLDQRKKKWRRRLSSSLLLSKATTTTARIVEHLIQHSHFIFSVLAIHFSHWSHRISTISYLYLSSIYLFLFLTMLSVRQWLWQCPMLLLSVDDGLKEPKWIGSTGTCTEETPRECRRERERRNKVKRNEKIENN